MRAFTRLVFDDQVAGTAAVFTADSHSDLMGSATQLAIQVVAGNVSGSGVSLTVRLQSSVDGRNWSYKSGTPEIDARSLTAGATATEAGGDNGQTPSLAKVRLSIALSGTAPAAQLRVWVTGRTSGRATRRGTTFEPASRREAVLDGDRDEGAAGAVDRAPSLRVRSVMKSSLRATSARGR